ncbi:MAG: MarC family protein [Deltaproteobacteria bacterium]|nr:MarC family protein [Deltaproteobacteria bacterium]
MEIFLKCFIPLFVAIDAPGNLPVFLGLTQQMTKTQRRRVIWQASATALFVAVGFLFAGKIILNFLHVTPADFKIAGGAVLFILAVRWVLPHTRPETTNLNIGPVPLGIPIFVGPAALTTLLMQVDVYAPYWVLASLVTNIAIIWVTCRFSDGIANWLGVSGMQAFAKVINLLLAALGVMMIRRGLEDILAR